MGGFQWGIYVTFIGSQRGRCLHWKKLKIKKEKKREYSRNRRHSLDEQIIPIHAQQIPDVEVKEDNAMLMEVGYRGDDILNQSPNRCCPPIMDINDSLAFQTERNLASK